MFSSEKIHNLSLADLEDAPMIYDVLSELEEWICTQLGVWVPKGQLDRTPFLRDVIICGQSMINDVNFLKEAHRYEKLKWPCSRVLLDLHTLGYFTFRVLRANASLTWSVEPDGHRRLFWLHPRRRIPQRAGRRRADRQVLERSV